MNKNQYDHSIKTPFPYPANLTEVIMNRERFEQWLKDSNLSFLVSYDVGDKVWEYEIETSYKSRALVVRYNAKARNGITFKDLNLVHISNFKAIIGSALAATICAQQYDEIRYYPGEVKFPIERLDRRCNQG